jgi:hypothetical protein
VVTKTKSKTQRTPRAAPDPARTTHSFTREPQRAVVGGAIDSASSSASRAWRTARDGHGLLRVPVRVCHESPSSAVERQESHSGLSHSAWVSATESESVSTTPGGDCVRRVSCAVGAGGGLCVSFVTVNRKHRDACPDPCDDISDEPLLSSLVLQLLRVSCCALLTLTAAVAPRSSSCSC